jgi:hypothetical protein
LVQNDALIGFIELDVDASEPITISAILNSAKKDFSSQLANGSDFRVYSGDDDEVLLSESKVWNVKSHGGCSKGNALSVKFKTPTAVPNQAISDGTCCCK